MNYFILLCYIHELNSETNLSPVTFMYMPENMDLWLNSLDFLEQSFRTCMLLLMRLIQNSKRRFMSYEDVDIFR
jgi:hypothetical protein